MAISVKSVEPTQTKNDHDQGWINKFKRRHSSKVMHYENTPVVRYSTSLSLEVHVINKDTAKVLVLAKHGLLQSRSSRRLLSPIFNLSTHRNAPRKLLLQEAGGKDNIPLSSFSCSLRPQIYTEGATTHESNLIFQTFSEPSAIIPLLTMNSREKVRVLARVYKIFKGRGLSKEYQEIHN